MEGDVKKFNALGWKIHDHIQRNRPKMFNDLKSQGLLEQHVRDLQRMADETLTTLEHRGLAPHETMEMIQDLIYPPTEEDVPNLGESLKPYTD